MKYMLLIHNDPSYVVGSDAEIAAEYGAFTGRIIESGEFLAGSALQGTDTATTVRVRDGRRTTHDGPFAETKEVLGGYYLVDVKDLDRALELAEEIPHAKSGSVEVRPLAEM